jgi:rhomboid-related protein 1/2/3
MNNLFSGSLLVSLTDPNVFLAGASGGVYALLAAHIANLLVNWNEMEFALIRAIAIGILVVSDFGVAIYNRYYSGSGEKSAEKVG